MLKAGSLTKLIELQSYAETRSASGHATRVWATYATVWAGVRTLSGRERLAAQQVSSVMTHEWSIRYRGGVQADHRIQWGTRYFDVKDMRNVDEANEEIRMLTTEVPAAGPVSSGSPSASASASPIASASA